MTDLLKVTCCLEKRKVELKNVKSIVELLRTKEKEKDMKID